MFDKSKGRHTVRREAPGKDNQLFHDACDYAEMPHSYRQWRKWLKGRGLAAQQEDPKIQQVAQRARNSWTGAIKSMIAQFVPGPYPEVALRYTPIGRKPKFADG